MSCEFLLWFSFMSVLLTFLGIGIILMIIKLLKKEEVEA